MSKFNAQLSSGSQLSGGKVAFSADGDTVLWRTGSNGVQVSQYTNSFTTVSSLPSTAAIASDKLNNSIFYRAASSSFYLSTDGGKTFSAKDSLGTSNLSGKDCCQPPVSLAMCGSLLTRGYSIPPTWDHHFLQSPVCRKHGRLLWALQLLCGVICILRVGCSRQYRLVAIPLCSLLPTSGNWVFQVRRCRRKLGKNQRC